MNPLPSDIVAKDVSQWLSEGWFYAEYSKNLFRIGRLLHVSPDNNTAIVTFLGKEFKDELMLPFDKLYTHWPQCGAINILPSEEQTWHGKFAMSLLRLQKKQWKRTYNSYCLKVRVISDVADHFNYGADSEPVIKAAFDPQYFSYTHAVKHMFPDGWRSVAITPNIIVSADKSNSQMVFLDGEVIGTISGTRFTCFNPGLKRRLLQHFDYLVE